MIKQTIAFTIKLITLTTIFCSVLFFLSNFLKILPCINKIIWFSVIIYLLFHFTKFIQICFDSKKKNEYSNYSKKESFLVKSIKAEKIYTISDLLLDIKFNYQEIYKLDKIAIIITFSFLWILWIATIFQYIIFLLCITLKLADYIVIATIGGKIEHKPLINIDRFDFKFYEILIIYLIEYPRINAFLTLYTLINKNTKIKKNIKNLWEKIIFAKTLGWSYNIFIKSIWVYKIIQNGIQSVNWQEKSKFCYGNILLEEIREKTSFFINASISDLSTQISKCAIIKENKNIKLNPLFQEIANFSDRIQFKKFLSLIVKENLEDLGKKLSIENKNLIDAAIWSQIYDAVFQNKKHLALIAAKGPTSLEDYNKDPNLNKLYLTKTFTHTERFKVENGNVYGTEIHAFTRIGDPEKGKTYTYVSALHGGLIKKFTNIRILKDYGINTYKELIIFRYIEDLKTAGEVLKAKEIGTIFSQGLKMNDKSVVSLIDLIKNGKLSDNCLIYLEDVIPEIEENIARAIQITCKEGEERLEEKIKKLMHEYGDNKILQNKKEIVDEIDNLKQELRNFRDIQEEKKEFLHEQIKNNFFKELRHMPVIENQAILKEILISEGLTGIADILTIKQIEETE